MKYYTVKRCSKCGKLVKIDFMWALLNLDEKILCEKCKLDIKKGVKNERKI